MKQLTDRQRFLIHLYTSPIHLVTLTAWSGRADYIERLTGDAESGRLVGERVYRQL